MSVELYKRKKKISDWFEAKSVVVKNRRHVIVFGGHRLGEIAGMRWFGRCVTSI